MWAKRLQKWHLSQQRANVVRGTWLVPILQHRCLRDRRLLLVTAHDEVQVAELPLELSTPKHSQQIMLLSLTCG